MTTTSLYMKSRYGRKVYEIEPHNRKTSGKLPITLLGMSEDNNMSGVYVASGLPKPAQTGIYGAGIAPDLAREAQPKTVTYTVLFDQGTGNTDGTRGYLRDFTHFLRVGVDFVRHGQYGGIGWDGYLADTPQVTWLNKRETQARVTFTLIYMTPFLSYHDISGVPNAETTHADYVVRPLIDRSGTGRRIVFPANDFYASLVIIPTSASTVKASALMNVEMSIGTDVNTTFFNVTSTRTTNVTLNTGYRYVYTSRGLSEVSAAGKTSTPVALDYAMAGNTAAGSMLIPPSTGLVVYFPEVTDIDFTPGVSPWSVALVKATP